jgi:hypothetical protein
MNLVKEEKKKTFFKCKQTKDIRTCFKKILNFNLKNLVDKIHKLIIKKLKLNVNHHIKTGKKSQPSSSLIMHNKA